MAKKSVVVCGATGFIGRNIAEFLARDDRYQIYGTYLNTDPYLNPNIKMIEADLSYKDEVEKVVQGKDIVIQAAATPPLLGNELDRPYIHVTDNAVMNSLIFRAAHHYGVPHLVFFSCSLMYQPKDGPVKEEDFDANGDIQSNYFADGWTKLYLEKMCKFFADLGRTKYTVIRHSSVYGPHDRECIGKSSSLGSMITKVLAGGEQAIRVSGTGAEEQDLLYVSDLVDFVNLALEKQTSPYELVNVAYGDTISVDHLFKKITKQSGKKLKVTYSSLKPPVKQKLILDYGRAREVFGWSPQTSLDEGIKKTVNWYRTNMYFPLS